MLKTISLSLILVSILFPLSNSAEWHTVENPTDGPTEIYGSYANGCFSGGVEIPVKGDGYEQVRPSRNRNYGTPNIAQFVHNLDQFGQNQGRVIILGDIAQPRGGPANFGHASHQTGLDIDIWLEERKDHLQGTQVEKLSTPSVVNPIAGKVNQHWKPFYRDLLHHAAIQPDTERIFVNPVIKAQLCATEKNSAWLEKLRPWYGHDSHFHVRLKCPNDSKGCTPQAPIPKGAGCDANLNNWVNDQIKWASTPSKPKSNTPPQPKPKPKPKKILPLACDYILKE